MDANAGDDRCADGDQFRAANSIHPLPAPLVVILAGGEGRRIGGGKPRRPLGGEPLIGHALRLARRWSDDVRVSIQLPGQAGALAVPEIIDDPAIAGPLAGLASALRAARSSGRAYLLTLPCDTPFLPGDLASRLSTAIGDHGAALAASDDRLHPACALWRVETLDRLPDYLASGRRSLTGFAEVIGFVPAQVPAAALLNVNTAEELARAELRLFQRQGNGHEPAADGEKGL